MHPGRLHEPSFTVYAGSKLSADESVQPGSRRPHPPESAVAEGSYPGRVLSVQPPYWHIVGSAMMPIGGEGGGGDETSVSVACCSAREPRKMVW